MITQTKSFKTSDNQLFQDKIEALTHEFKIEIRGILQGNSLSRADNFTSTQVADLIVKNSNQFTKTIQKYREAIRRATPAKKEMKIAA